MEDKMNDRKYTTEETLARGEAIYRRDICSKVEPRHNGEYVVIDIVTGDYSISGNELAAFDLAEQKNPNGWFYVKRIGHEAVHRIGGTRPIKERSG